LIFLIGKIETKKINIIKNNTGYTTLHAFAFGCLLYGGARENAEAAT